jgi:hypothetical protein
MIMDFYSRLLKELLFSCFLAGSFSLYSQDTQAFIFVSPKPASSMVSAETNIILRYSFPVDQSSLSRDLLQVEGKVSGEHKGAFLLSDDSKTLVFNPYKPFASNEDVRVVLRDGIKTMAGGDVPGYTFSFKTARTGVVQKPKAAFEEMIPPSEDIGPTALKAIGAELYLPPPPISIDSINEPSEGNIFLATWDRNVPAKYGNFIFVLDKYGAIVDSVRVDGAPYDFQVQPNGLLSYALGDFASSVPLPGEELQHMVLDETLAVVDSFKMKNGYITDFHEFKMLPNGHVMMMSYHTILYDMSTVVEGGLTDASLVINIIQEQDRDKNVVFEWRNIDYIPITDSDLDLTESRINYGTLNAFDIDDDGNILASFRNHSEIMKISRTTGEVIWRMGGPNSEFAYVGEHEENAPYYHARQHHIRKLPNGNISLFDNGEFHSPPYSRAVEYSLDEVNKVATLVSEWRYPNGNIFCITAGNAELLSNGGWFIGYGVPNPQFVKRNAVEVHPDGSIALELSLPAGVLAYRANKFPWKETVQKPSFTHFEVKEGNTYSFNNESISTGVEIRYNSLGAADYNESTITRVPYGPIKPEFIDHVTTVYPASIIYEGFAITSQNADFHVNLEVYPEIHDPENTIVYLREFPGHGLFNPKSTSYNPAEDELIATLNGFGEIVFGIPDYDPDNQPPIPYQPLKGQKLVMQDSVTIRWTGKGLYDSFNVQVATDSQFASLLHDSVTNLSDLSIKELTNHTTYYWRVRSLLGSQYSQWSETCSFEITDPFIRTISPNGGEIWTRGKTHVIRWETNLQENLRINLLQNGSFLLALDTLPGSHQAYAWEVPEELPSGENYSIEIVSESNSEIFGASDNMFTISDFQTRIDELEYSGTPEYRLDQNFPNPFYSSTTISYTLQKASFVSLKVYNLVGKEIQILVEDFQGIGKYSVHFNGEAEPGGVYFYRLEAGNEFVETKMMIQAR